MSLQHPRPESIHEAGHAVVLWAVLRKIAEYVSVELDKPTPDGEIKAGLDHPTNGSEATRYVAYYHAGREAVAEAIRRGAAPSNTDPNWGFSEPPGGENDAAKIQLLDSHRPAESEARQLARKVVVENWPTVVAIAARLESAGRIEAGDLRALLSDVQQS